MHAAKLAVDRAFGPGGDLALLGSDDEATWSGELAEEFVTLAGIADLEAVVCAQQASHWEVSIRAAEDLADGRAFDGDELEVVLV